MIFFRIRDLSDTKRWSNFGKTFTTLTLKPLTLHCFLKGSVSLRFAPIDTKYSEEIWSRSDLQKQFLFGVGGLQVLRQGFEGCVFWSMDPNWKCFLLSWSYRNFMGIGLWICRCSQICGWCQKSPQPDHGWTWMKGTLQYNRNIVKWHPCRAYLYG